VHRAHGADPIPQLTARADGNSLTLTVSRRWLDAHPLIRADLEGEPQDMAGLGIAMRLEVA
jgi:exopolyphosphatase/guanosine-5'-triphosphate,3'-diphosphate pyrophosphatase